MKYVLKVFLLITIIQNVYSQNEIFEKFEVINLNDFEETMHVSVRLIEIIDDNLLIGTALNKFYLYNLEEKKISASIQLEFEAMASDIISSEDNKYFILNLNTGLIILDKKLHIYKEIKIKGSPLMEIKTKENLVYRRTENSIQKIDWKKGKIIEILNFKSKGYDIELLNNSNCLLPSESELIIIDSLGNIKSIKKVDGIIENIISVNDTIYMPLTFKNERLFDNFCQKLKKY